MIVIDSVGGKHEQISITNVCPCLKATHYKFPPVIYCFDGDKIGKAERNGGSGFGMRDDGVCYTLTVKDVHAVGVPNDN